MVGDLLDEFHGTDLSDRRVTLTYEIDRRDTIERDDKTYDSLHSNASSRAHTSSDASFIPFHPEYQVS